LSPNAQMMEASGETSGVGSHAMLPTVVDGSAPRGGDVCQSAGGLSSVASCESIGSCTDSFVMVPEGYEEGTGKKGLRGEAVDAMRSISFAAGKKGAAAKAALAKKKAAVAAEARSNYKAGKVAVKAGIAAAKEQAAGDLPPLPSENRDMRGRSRSTGKTNGRRSVAAVEGIMLLKKGSTAVKYSRKGKPRSATFKLSKDEAVLSWTGARAAGLMGSGRSVVLADVVELVIGNQSGVFQRSIQRAAEEANPIEVPAHLCFSLILIGAMPRPPSEMDDEAESAEPLNTDRTTLDISLDDEETFGYWVAALRALVSEVRNKPVAYASPLNPMHASAAASLRKDAPPDATMLEKLRDASLLCLDWYSKTWFFMIFTAIWALGVVVFGAMYAFLLVGWYGQKPMYTDVNGTELYVDGAEGWTVETSTDIGNVCIQILTAQFTYILSLTAPWRLGNLFHLWAKELGMKRRCNAEGFDLYGRPTTGIWFWIPTRKRKVIVGLLVANLFFQYATQATRVVFPSYADSQSILGAIFINFTFVTSIICGIASGNMQTACEGQVRKENPDKFPPTPMEHALKAWKEAKEKEKEETSMGLKPKRNSILGAATDAVAGAATRVSRLSMGGQRNSNAPRPSFMLTSPSFTNGGKRPSLGIGRPSASGRPDSSGRGRTPSTSEREAGEIKVALKYESVEEERAPPSDSGSEEAATSSGAPRQAALDALADGISSETLDEEPEPLTVWLDPSQPPVSPKPPNPGDVAPNPRVDKPILLSSSC